MKGVTTKTIDSGLSFAKFENKASRLFQRLISFAGHCAEKHGEIFLEAALCDVCRVDCELSTAKASGTLFRQITVRRHSKCLKN